MSKAPFAADQRRPLEDFMALTGLKPKYAKGCFDRFGGYAPALASFAQSYAALPSEYFEDAAKVEQNAELINEELKLIYKRAREIKHQSGKPDAGVWAAYYAKESLPASKPQAVNGAAADATPKPFGSAFSFTTTKAAAPPSGTINFGFGAQPTPSSSVSAPVSAIFGGFAQAKKTEEKATEPSREREVRYCEPSHFTGPLFDMPLFWKEEVEERCPLLNLNKGFLEENRELLRGRLEKWVKKAGFYLQPVKYVGIEDDDEETIRVIIKDAERTFFHPEHRKKFIAFLSAMHNEFNAYGQAMSYLAGLSLLVLNEEETAAVLRYVTREHIPGHWAAEAVGFSTTAWVVEAFMQLKFPDVAKHLEELKLWPDTYLQKVLTGLCIHVLDFEELFVFLDLFMEGGVKFLIKYCLAIVEHFRSDLLRVKSAENANQVYEIMRLDAKVADSHDVREILRRAPLIDLGPEGDTIDILRMEAYDKKVAPRLQRAPKTEAFEPCALCNERKPVWWNDDLGAVCSECKDGAPDLPYTKY
ncbi:putative GTPase activating protein [Trypanosoma conorhini]|uniref:Putative GTPase activating protein n=1 Tax=Trypanosoma conorhini TaxID=83891 RepID=A0A422PAM8_9TRYP|nr:putative GTPase activating protein [Trypanosoma conorhini]RNF14752.1 putative GTPase activating protein [Trypanosoma conorhini]